MMLVQIVGYYDIDDQEIGAYLTAAGSQVGAKYSAGIKNGINFGFNLPFAGGNVGIFVSGNELKIRYGVWAGVGFFKKEYNDEAKLLNV